MPGLPPLAAVNPQPASPEMLLARAPAKAEEQSLGASAPPVLSTLPATMELVALDAPAGTMPPPRLVPPPRVALPATVVLTKERVPPSIAIPPPCACTVVCATLPLTVVFTRLTAYWEKIPPPLAVPGEAAPPTVLPLICAAVMLTVPAPPTAVCDTPIPAPEVAAVLPTMADRETLRDPFCRYTAPPDPAPTVAASAALPPVSRIPASDSVVPTTGCPAVNRRSAPVPSMVVERAPAPLMVTSLLVRLPTSSEVPCVRR